MANLDTLIKDLVIANRILAKEDVVDAYGHVSVRNPDNPKHFFLSRSRLAGTGRAGRYRRTRSRRPAGARRDPRALSRALHPCGDLRGAARHQCRWCTRTPRTRCRSASPQATPLQPVIHSGSFIGANVPVWDIADKFGDTNLLVTNIAQGRDLAKCLGNNSVALMRGHGFASAGRSLIEVVRMSVYLPRNARALIKAQAARRRGQISRARARSTRAMPATARIRPRRGVPGSSGRPRPAAATCSRNRTRTRTGIRTRPRSKASSRLVAATGHTVAPCGPGGARERMLRAKPPH